jgi:hypothetical protein
MDKSEENLMEFKKKLQEYFLAFLKMPNRSENLRALLREVDRNNKKTNYMETAFAYVSKLEDKRSQSTNAMAMFLWLYEGYYLAIINLVCFLLTTSDHDLFNPFNKEFSETFDEIVETDTATKIRFLKKHGLGLLERENDRKLRNRIAHFDFDVDNKNNVRVSGTTVDVKNRNKELVDFTNCVRDCFTDCLVSILKNHGQSPSDNAN